MAGADTTCSVRTVGGRGDDVLETVARIGGKLASEEGGEAAVVVESLRELQGVRMTFEALESTKIGRAVNALRKSAPSEQARQLATVLYSRWKALADERFRSSRTQQQPPPPKADKGVKKRSSLSPPPVNAKQSAGHEGGNREMAPTPTSVVVEATPETKLHLHKVFDSAAVIKKPSSLRVVKVNTNAPLGKAEQRRVTIVRRAAIPEPAPASNTTRRNDGGSKSNRQANCPVKANHQGTNAAAKHVSPTSAAPLTTAKPPPALPKPINGSSGACKRKAEPSMVFDEARLARATKRLHEGYKEIAAAKEKRKIKEIKVIAAQGKERQRPALSVRCAAGHRTGKQAPAMACPPRMPMAF